MDFHLVFLVLFASATGTIITHVGQYKVCVSPMNEISGFPIDRTYHYIKSLFSSGCRLIVGNVILFGLHPENDGSDPDFSFLQSIEEITGYLIIMNNSVREIPLSSLRIIRGIGSGYVIQNDLPPASLLIRHNHHTRSVLRKIDFSNLRVIQNGDVYMFDNPGGCNLTPGVPWSTLFQSPSEQHFHNSTDLKSISDSACSSVPPAQNQGRCTKLNFDWCYQVLGPGGISEEYQCHPSCLGGCSGPTAFDCYVCKDLREGNQCVEKCSSPVTVQNYQLTLNDKFKYKFHGFCVDDCPLEFFAEGTRCIRECTPGKYYPSGQLCIPCGENCPKANKSVEIMHELNQTVCTVGVNGSLDATALASLKYCTKLSGNLVISEESYSSNLPERLPITTSEELWALHSLREVSGYVYLDLRAHPTILRDLTFLENLRKIGGSKAGFSLAVLPGQIEYAGLHNLRETPHGNITFMESPSLCYVQSIVSPNLRIRLHEMPSAAECSVRGALCHPTCDLRFGCWGPRRQDCLRCRSHSIDGSVCVSSCTELPGFYETPRDINLTDPGASTPSNPLTRRLQLARLASGHVIDEPASVQGGGEGATELAKSPVVCERCHPECAETCLGPAADQCVGRCKHAKYLNECVAECPQDTFFDAQIKTCVRCATQCHQRKLSGKPVCSGTGIYPGPGGCNKCDMFLEFISFDGLLKETSVRTQHGALLCMRGSCPQGTFKTMESVEAGSRFAAFVEEGVHAVPVCRSCHTLCLTCTGYSLLRATNTTPGCLDCNGFWFRDTCVKECPAEFTFQISLTHPPEMHKAFHFRQSLDVRGLFLPARLNSPVRGSDIFPRPQLWSRHLDGRCLLCHPQCLGGCWGPTAAQCNRCANVRVWHEGTGPSEAKTWSPSHDPKSVYMLNREAFGEVPFYERMQEKSDPQKTLSMYFTCEPSCPPSMPYVSNDPVTGDITCHSIADGENLGSIYLDRRRDESSRVARRLGAGLVGPLAVALLLCLLCIGLTCCWRSRNRRAKNALMVKPLPSLLSSFIDKMMPKGAQTSRVVSYIAGSGPVVVTRIEERGGRGASLYAASNRITWSSEGSGCQYCRDSSAEGSRLQSTGPLVCRNSYCYNPIYRRSTRQQPNMGRLVLINLDDIVLPPSKVPLGNGAFGAVYRGIWKIPGDVEDVQLPTTVANDGRRHVNVAVKILNEAHGSEDLQALLEEAKVMCSLRHRNCLQLLGVCLAGSQRYLVSEYIANGSLDNYIRRYRNELPYGLLLLWAEQIADGMAYLQSAGIIHRDLATRNVLVKEQDWVQITDFGLAKMLNGEDENERGEVIVQSGRVPIRWLAIETLTSGRYSFKTDIWSYGVTLWEIFTFGQRPYPNIETKDVKRYVVTGGRLSQPDICTLEAYQRLLLACWRENPEERITFADILQILRSKADTPEYFLHARPTSSLISAQTRSTRLSGAYSDRRDSNSGPKDENALAFGASASTTRLPPGNSSVKAQTGVVESTLPPRFPPLSPVIDRGGEESLPTSVEYTSAPHSSRGNGSSAEATLVAVDRRSTPIGGGYVWPMPLNAAATNNTAAMTAGEYVGPLFQNPSEVDDVDI